MEMYPCFPTQLNNPTRAKSGLCNYTKQAVRCSQQTLQRTYKVMRVQAVLTNKDEHIKY